MCTATYIPKGNNEFLLTHNRDEFVLRGVALMPQINNFALSKCTNNILQLAEPLNNQNFKAIYPKDADAHGSWIGFDEHNKSCCLLNGAFASYAKQPPYTHSRGLIPLFYWQCATINEFIQNFEPQGLEPFTFIMCHNRQLHTYIWDGTQVYTQQLDATTPHIWSSAALYTPEQAMQRCNWFTEFLQQNNNINANQIIQFHTHGGQANQEYNMVIQRPKQLTVSITSIAFEAHKMTMQYYDLINKKHKYLNF